MRTSPILCVLGETCYEAEENNLGTDAIRPLVLRIAIPSMLAQFVSVLYSIVDRIYISNIPWWRPLSRAWGCGPVVTLIGAFASLIGVGGAPLMSIRMGAGKRRRPGGSSPTAF